MDEFQSNATLQARQQVAASLKLLWIAPDAGEVPAFEPGQFVQVGLMVTLPARAGRGGAATATRQRPVWRAYSIASSARERRFLELCVVQVPGGRLTTPLWDLEPGERVWLENRARGEFTPDLAPRGADMIWIATGTGVAPFVSMLRTYSSGERWRRAVLVHGVRRAEELVYRVELEERARADRAFTYLPVVSREPEWTGLRGRVQVALAEGTWRSVCATPLDATCAHVYLCGNPEMIRDVGQSLLERGFTADRPGVPGNLHYERYW